MPDQPSHPRWRSLWRIVFLLHVAGAMLWWWMMPGGFSVGHARFWTNGPLPAVVAAGGCAGIFVDWRGWWRLRGALVAAVVAGWTSLVVTAAVVFPISSQRLLPFGLIGLSLLWLAGFVSLRPRQASLPRLFVLAPFAVAAGAFMPWAQRGGPPDTRPLDVEFDEAPFEGTVPQFSSPAVSLGDGIDFFASDGSITFRAGSLTLDIQPRLTFISRSPDRCWTIFAPPADRDAAPIELLAMDEARGSVQMWARGDCRHWVKLHRGDGNALSLDARTKLDRPIYSHLNTFCDLTISGHRRLSLSFSPCPDQPIDVLPADYPTGRPARFAYLDDATVFHVVQATSGEKGPFRRLASGSLRREDALTITFCDEGIAVCDITFEDWAAQAGVALSPTAGWGVPVNAIEFPRLGDDESAPAAIYMTLAGTSVGRGWDSVGHAAGVYCNRIVISRRD